MFRFLENWIYLTTFMVDTSLQDAGMSRVSPEMAFSHRVDIFWKTKKNSPNLQCLDFTTKKIDQSSQLPKLSKIQVKLYVELLISRWSLEFYKHWISWAAIEWFARPTDWAELYKTLSLHFVTLHVVTFSSVGMERRRCGAHVFCCEKESKKYKKLTKHQN